MDLNWSNSAHGRIIDQRENLGLQRRSCVDIKSGQSLDVFMCVVDSGTLQAMSQTDGNLARPSPRMKFREMAKPSFGPSANVGSV